jgi:hypothetical protein
MFKLYIQSFTNILAETEECLSGDWTQQQKERKSRSIGWEEGARLIGLKVERKVARPIAAVCCVANITREFIRCTWFFGTHKLTKCFKNSFKIRTYLFHPLQLYTTSVFEYLSPASLILN